MNSQGIRMRWALFVLVAGGAAGCDFPGKPKPGDRPVPPQEITAFSDLFRANCVGCHGKDGRLGPAPPLNDKLFLALVPDTTLEHVIAAGRAGTLMPAFDSSKGGPLTADQVNSLARGLKARWGSQEAAPHGAPSYECTVAHAGGRTAESKAGLEVFARACASCHGDRGEGLGSVGAINDPTFLALMSDQALRRTVITGRPDLGMPDYADSTGRPKGFHPLTAEDVVNVAALLAEWREGRSHPAKGD